jgi:hypothetical protein
LSGLAELVTETRNNKAVRDTAVTIVLPMHITKPQSIVGKITILLYCEAINV